MPGQESLGQQAQPLDDTTLESVHQQEADSDRPLLAIYSLMRRDYSIQNPGHRKRARVSPRSTNQASVVVLRRIRRLPNDFRVHEAFAKFE